MTTKSKILRFRPVVISSCSDCCNTAHSPYSSASPFGEPERYDREIHENECLAANKHISDTRTIPDFCPLEDA